MDEYLETLKILAAEGDKQAAKKLEEAIAYKKKNEESAQRTAFELKRQGFDVIYHKGGGIEFSLNQEKKGSSEK